MRGDSASVCGSQESVGRQGSSVPWETAGINISFLNLSIHPFTYTDSAGSARADGRDRHIDGGSGFQL